MLKTFNKQNISNKRLGVNTYLTYSSYPFFFDFLWKWLFHHDRELDIGTYTFLLSCVVSSHCLGTMINICFLLFVKMKVSKELAYFVIKASCFPNALDARNVIDPYKQSMSFKLKQNLCMRHLSWASLLNFNLTPPFSPFQYSIWRELIYYAWNGWRISCVFVLN